MSGNAVILRGGSEAAQSNRAIHAALASGLAATGLPIDAVQFVPTQDSSEQRRVGYECVSTGRSRGPPSLAHQTVTPHSTPTPQRTPARDELAPSNTHIVK